jgi:hypothetical protein
MRRVLLALCTTTLLATAATAAAAAPAVPPPANAAPSAPADTSAASANPASWLLAPILAERPAAATRGYFEPASSFLTPVARPLSSGCTCTSEAQACSADCLSIGCWPHFTCNQGDPCNSLCYCWLCGP